MTLTRTTLILTALLLGGTQAQTATPTATPTVTTATTPQTAAQAAAEAGDLAAKARATYPKGSASIDQDLWKRAAAAAERAVAAAPSNPDYLRLRAQIYTEVGFWRQAELGWEAYFRAVPNGAAAAETASAASVQYNLGYSAYTRNQPSQAAAFFANCLKLDPASVPCTTWAARTALEAGNYAQAQTLYDRALVLQPADKTLSYFRALAQSAGRYGPAATRAFSRAYGELDAGRKAQALAGFQQAAADAPNFAEAWREAGKLALELGDAPAALAAYTGAAALPTATAADRYNLSVAQEGASVGLRAVQAFRAAYTRYTAGDKTAAETGFLEATTLSPKYAKAWAWLGRTRYETRNFGGAAQAYAQAVQLDPNDKSSAYFLRLAQQGK
ncbi:tetratricopeptide repeat protein [Deinococcus puniceus]|uniref:Uncharacterized protein n=1 Tax=Deinococcus puniceus TaxID=1182568 RepID=A0A172T6K2_9DEIO|nr:tetratricopeptide repeat protein [Deinococcus puniceus]ANE42592.1 hypothetical protein SU48_01120 [Deinococcus puniceus]